MAQAAPQGFTLTVPLVKIDVERRLVIGRAACQEEDKAREVMDYATAKPRFQKWSDSYALNQIPGAEMSKGNLRVMHSRSVAGKLTELAFNDDAKSVDIVCKIVDDNEWAKVQSGCYTGFSIGGGYADKWQKGGLTHYTPDVREISLVDNPCMPSARIVELVKADGMVGELELRGKSPSGFAAAWAARPKSFAQQWAERPVAPRTYAELAKAEFDESKHNRDHGKFASTAGGAAAGAAIGAAVGIAHHNAPAAIDRLKYGSLLNRTRSAQNSARPVKASGNPTFTDSGNTNMERSSVYTRNKLAAKLRSDGKRGGLSQRREIKRAGANVRSARVSFNNDDRTTELAGAAHRKVMEEAANDGRNLDHAKIDADRAVDSVKRFAARVRTKQVASGAKGAANAIRNGVLQAARTVRTPKFSWRGGLGLGLAGAALGATAAYNQWNKDA